MSVNRKVTAPLGSSGMREAWTARLPGVQRESDEDVDRVALCFEHDPVVVAEVLAVRLHWEQPVARDLDGAEVVAVDDLGIALLAAAAHDVADVARHTPQLEAGQADDIEAELESRLGH